MVFTERDLQDRLAEIRQQGQRAYDAIEQEYEDHVGWLKTVFEGVKNGTINVKTVLVPKTPGKPKKAPLTAITESLESSIELNISDDVKNTRNSSQNKRASRKAQTKKATLKAKEPIRLIIEEDADDTDNFVTKKSQKRLSEETIDSASKRLCGNRPSETTSRDSGLSSVGSRQTRGSTLGGGAIVKQEVLTPKNTSLQSTVSNQNEGVDSENEDDQSQRTSAVSSPGRTNQAATQDVATPEPQSKRSRSAGRGTFVVKQEPRRSSRSISEPRESVSQADRTLVLNVGKDAQADRTIVLNTGKEAALSTPSMTPPGTPVQMKNKTNTLRSPLIKAPPVHLLKGESVKKAVKAFEALSEDTDAASDEETESADVDVPFMPPPSKLRAPKVVTSSQASSLDDALNAPTRVTRTKTRAMAKAAAADDKKTQKDEQTTSAVSRMLKSPVQQHHPQKNFLSASKALDRRDDFYEKENSSRIHIKPFGSASKQQSLFFKPSTPLNRMAQLSTSHCSSASIVLNRVNNLVTSVESFIQKAPVQQEIKPSREENLQKLVAKTEVASKKKEEIMKAQREEKMKKRQEKRERVCAAREAMEKEKLELHLRQEREREEKQRQLQAEREEKLRQEYLKKKRLAQQKAAETEERRRQEEAARLAKLKQQEEEQRRLAAQRRKEQEEAERKQMERLQQEREAAAHRAREAEKLAKEAALKAKKESKIALDQTYDKSVSTSDSYGMTPGPDERQPIPSANADNYGIDDAASDDSSEDEAKPKKVVPLWAQSKQRLPKLFEDYEITHAQVFRFFESKKSTPDLSKIFTAIDRRQLIRKSSAVWRTPPGKY